MERQLRRLDRQNQALKQSLLFALGAIRKLSIGVSWANPLIDQCNQHMRSIQALVLEAKSTEGRGRSNGALNGGPKE